VTLTAAAVALSVLLQPAVPPVRIVERGSQSAVEEARQVVATSAEQFAALWRAHSSKPAPAVDFSEESVVAVFLGTRRTAGYTVEIVSVSHDQSGTLVRYREQGPPAGGITAQVLTFPYVIAAVRKVLAPVRFESAP
jgi:hypothetical protein